MRLDRVLAAVDLVEVQGNPTTVEVASITHDSRTVLPGALYCCVPGTRTDGHDFAADAVHAGATALLCERILPLGVAQARVAPGQVRPAMAQAAAAIHGHPSRALRVAGVTGTNGKTTVTHLLAAILEAAGLPAGVIGTLSGARTTPEAPELQAELARLRDAGRAAVAMEVSSHALAQHRVDAVHFAVGVFTNLSPEHLDYHGTMEAYFEAKARLFEPDRTDEAVINADDPYGARLLSAGSIPSIPYSLDDANNLEVSATSSRFRWDGVDIRLHLGGRHNVLNALAAALAARQLGAGTDAVAAGLDSVTTVPGRLETIEMGQDFVVLVDYAHTPDGLERVLSGVRETAPGARLVTVFGCGGDRDRGKRPLMGEIATRLSDLVVLTSDNPRSEDPHAIIDEVKAGVRRHDRLVIEPDREVAIRRAISAAGTGDVVVIAGKGHETGQVVGATTLPFDDREVARHILGQSDWAGARR